MTRNAPQFSHFAARSSVWNTRITGSDPLMGEMARTYPKEVACQPIKFSPSPYPAPLQRNRQPFFRRSHSALAPELHDKRLKRRFVHVGFWAAHVAAARPYRSSWASVILRRCARRDSRSSLKLIALRFAIGTLFR